MTEVIVEVNKEGYWIFPDQKGRGYTPFMPVDALTHILARKLKMKRTQEGKYFFKITDVDE